MPIALSTCPLITSPLDFADYLIGCPITSRSTAQALPDAGLSCRLVRHLKEPRRNMTQAQLKEESRKRQHLESELSALRAAHSAALADAEGAAAAATAQATQAAATAERLQAELGEARDAIKVPPPRSLRHTVHMRHPKLPSVVMQMATELKALNPGKHPVRQDSERQVCMVPSCAESCARTRHWQADPCGTGCRSRLRCWTAPMTAFVS